MNTASAEAETHAPHAAINGHGRVTDSDVDIRANSHGTLLLRRLFGGITFELRRTRCYVRRVNTNI